jgi:hypothetical protein
MSAMVQMWFIPTKTHTDTYLHPPGIDQHWDGEAIKRADILFGIFFVFVFVALGFVLRALCTLGQHVAWPPAHFV